MPPLPPPLIHLPSHALSLAHRRARRGRGRCVRRRRPWSWRRGGGRGRPARGTRRRRYHQPSARARGVVGREESEEREGKSGRRGASILTCSTPSAASSTSACAPSASSSSQRKVQQPCQAAERRPRSRPWHGERRMRQATASASDANTPSLIKEFDRVLKDEEKRNTSEVNKQLNDKKQFMIKELNSYVTLRKTYQSSLGNKRIELFDAGNDQVDNVQMA